MTVAKRRAESELDGQVPKCVRWTAEEVADWIQSLGYPQYKVWLSFYITIKFLVCK